MELEKRVEKMENSHSELAQAFRDFSKDFHHLGETLEEVKEVLKAIGKTETDFALFRQKFDTYVEQNVDTVKRLHERMNKIEGDAKKGAKIYDIASFLSAAIPIAGLCIGGVLWLIEHA